MKKRNFGPTIIMTLLIFIFGFSFISVPKTVNTKSSQHKPTLESWWVYDPGYAPRYPSTFSESIQPANYRPLRITENIITLCDGSEVVCAIYAEPDPFNVNRPYIQWFTPAYSELADFFSTGYVNTSIVRLKDL